MGGGEDGGEGGRDGRREEGREEGRVGRWRRREEEGRWRERVMGWLFVQSSATDITMNTN